MDLDYLAMEALKRFVRRYHAAGMTVMLPMAACGEETVHRMVDVGKHPKALAAIDVLADEFIQCRVERFVELPSRNLNPGVATKVITDMSSGITLRVTMSKDGIVFDVAGIGDRSKLPDATIH
jgi:hypothetical protein